MRGKLCNLKVIDCSPRITPADAGKTEPLEVQHSVPPDHPRGCGENTGFKHQRFTPQGSPPRMRGKLFLDFRRNLDSGITPADAGKT